MNGPIGLLVSAALLLTFFGCGSGAPAIGSESPKEEDAAATPDKPQSDQPLNQSEEDPMEQTVFYVSVGGTTFAADFADTTGAQGLQALLADGPVSISMRDYGSFEKVGALGKDLPTNDSSITTQSGDIVLYQGNQIVLFYGSNSWSYTRLGKVRDLTGWAEALGSGDVTVTFSLSDDSD